jgi:Zn-dependent peptidase ImmA (M78 family)/transcriptional regulator with XRE-family HTH domain
MTFNLKALGSKLSRYRNQFQYSLSDISIATGILEEKLFQLENGECRPSGDEILILADFYKCDYKFFLSNEKLASFEQTETLFRRFGSDFSKKDRWAVQECLFLAECEAYLEKRLNKQKAPPFSFQKVGDYYKGHGNLAAKNLRQHLGYSEKEVSMNIYKDMRNIGIRVFRRKLENSNISGLYIKHPVAGKCVLINYDEDTYRQRFTAAHEAAHTILDEDEDVLVSFPKNKGDYKEVRANAFASAYLMPLDAISKIPNCDQWTNEKAIEWANKFKVSTSALAIALKNNNLIDRNNYQIIKESKVPRQDKKDPELSDSLSPLSKNRKQHLLERGLSDYYVGLCFEGYRANIVAASRLTEMFLLESDGQLRGVSVMYGASI